MSVSKIVVGVVGKPSSGKSTFFNAVTDGANAKTGNYPFTTIDPNRSITYYKHRCPCADLPGITCTPKHGRCVEGTRLTPVELLDVAGLIPGASGGAGLGNKFLNDLCGAKALIHVIDASGRTNEKGEATSGHDPVTDVLWLHQEIQDWIVGNVTTKWATMTRRHTSQNAHSAMTGGPTVAESLNRLFSGYGANAGLMATVLKVARLPPNPDIAGWGDEDIRKFVAVFQALRFPTLLFLNKADVGGDTDKNVARLCKQFGSSVCHVGSAAAECFVRRAAAEGHLHYPMPGGEFTLTPAGEGDEKVVAKVARLQGRLVERFGGTGVWDVVQAAVAMTRPVPVFPVSTLPSLPPPSGGAASSEGGSVTSGAGGAGRPVLPTCLLLPDGVTVRAVAGAISHDIAAGLTHAEGLDGKSISPHWALKHDGERGVVLKLHVDKRKAAAAVAEREEGQ